MFTVEEFMEMFIDGDSQYFQLWDNEKGDVIFKGYLSELPDELRWAEVTSIDNIYEGKSFDGIVLNIDR